MKHIAKIESEFVKQALSEKERLKKPLDVDLELELRIGGNANPHFRISTNIDEEDYTYNEQGGDSGDKPSSKNYLQWAAQLKEVIKWLNKKAKD